MSEVKFGSSTQENLKNTQINAADWKDAQLRRQASPGIWNSMLNAATYVPRELANVGLMQAEDMAYGPSAAQAVQKKRDALQSRTLDAYRVNARAPGQWESMLKGNWKP